MSVPDWLAREEAEVDRWLQGPPECPECREDLTPGEDDCGYCELIAELEQANQLYTIEHRAHKNAMWRLEDRIDRTDNPQIVQAATKALAAATKQLTEIS